jgi:hypothetical protein|tara:strand:+ start:523 stop:705 length:183 start_codon:yes stop_codon:yes gene_type:complete
MEIKDILSKDDMNKIIDLVEAKCDENPDGYKTSKWLNDLTGTRQRLYKIWHIDYCETYKL